MSCRVFSRGLEYAILNVFVENAKRLNVGKIIGKYVKSNKNALVSDLYTKCSFEMINENTFYVEPLKFESKKHNITIKSDI